MNKLSYRIKYAAVIALAFFAVTPTIASANHSWGNYHWARPSNPFTVRIGDNVSSTWKPYLSRAAYNWDRSSILSAPVTAGSTSPTLCKMKAGTVQVCNASYGKSGWLGLTQLNTYGNHITQASVKLNEYYFNNPTYNTVGWKNLVVCQEIGHSLGLDHQDENFSNAPLGTCMDYSSNTTPNQQPNMHDYYHLLTIYNHRDTWSSLQDSISTAQDATAGVIDYNDKNQWGTKVSQGDQIQGTNDIAEYERDLGGNNKLRTIVIWAK